MHFLQRQQGQFSRGQHQHFSQGQNAVRREFDPVMRSIHSLRHFVHAQASAAGLSVAAIGLIEIAAVEVFTNMVRHGGAASRPTPVLVESRLANGYFETDFIHRGDAFVPTDRVDVADRFESSDRCDPSAPFEPLPLSELHEGGFGLQIINTVFDQVRYWRCDGENTIRLRKSLDLPDSLSFEKRLQNIPDVFKQPLLGGFVRMNSVGLKKIETIGDSIE
jgi:anti-sigma regulatory factor (Ser/Thr protein kinase)